MREHFWFAGLSMAALGVVQLLYVFRMRERGLFRSSRIARAVAACADSAMIVFGLLLASGRVS